MSELRVGFGMQDITPALGCYLQGNPKVRIAQSVHDPLYVRCVIFENQGIAVLLYFDLIGIRQELAEDIRAYTALQLGCDRKDVFVCATHTHTGPNMHAVAFPTDETYKQRLPQLAAQAAIIAKNDLHLAQLHFAQDTLPGITFVRRYLMKDGTCRTNPGRRNPDIVRPMSPADEGIQLLKITRKDAGDIALINFQCHPDVVKSDMEIPAISADYPGMVCSVLESAIPGLSCMYCNGTAGDLNSADVHCPEWDRNTGIEHALHMARNIAGKILSLYTKARPLDGSIVKTSEQLVELPRKKATSEQIARSQKIVDAYAANQLDIIPGKPGTMEFITSLYEARMYLGSGRDGIPAQVRVSAFRIGDFAAAGLPGEPFCQIGMDIKNTSPFPAQFTLGLTNGCQGYFPSEEAFGVNGYEARTSSFMPCVAQRLTDAAIQLLQELKEDAK